ncbi:hypothetical protein BTVI_63563 [Pitangus sulphuratus]|nr:hypothetical protein BTVI_63563 [Pitangus sulphuratus]
MILCKETGEVKGIGFLQEEPGALLGKLEPSRLVDVLTTMPKKPIKNHTTRKICRMDTQMKAMDIMPFNATRQINQGLRQVDNRFLLHHHHSLMSHKRLFQLLPTLPREKTAGWTNLRQHVSTQIRTGCLVLRSDSRLQDHSHPLYQWYLSQVESTPLRRLHRTRLVLEESTDSPHPEPDHASYTGAKSFTQFETDNRRRKHLTIVLHKDIMRKSGFHSKESRKTLRKSLDKLRVRFNNRCHRLLYGESPPGLLLERSFIESVIEPVPRLELR